MIDKKAYLDSPDKLLYKKPFTRGADSALIESYRYDAILDNPTFAHIPDFTGKVISQTQYLLELDPNSHAIVYNDDLPRLSSNPNATWDEANPYRASFAFQSQILSQHNQYVNTKGMKFTMLNTNPSDEIRNSFVSIKDEWISRNMDVKKEELYLAQKSMGDAAMLFYFDRKKRSRTRILTYKDGYQLIPQYDENGDMLLFSVYYRSNKKYRLDVYDEEFIYSYVRSDDTKGGSADWVLEAEPVKHGYSDIPIVYKRGEVAWEKGQGIIDIFELMYNIYMIIEKKVGFPILYIIGKAGLKKKSDTAVTLQDTSIENSKSDAKFLNPDEPTGFQNLLKDLFQKIQICTSSVLIAPDEIKITADVSGIAMKLLRSSIYERAQRDIRDYDEVADKMFSLFKEGVSRELGVYSSWNLCRVRAEYEIWSPQSETELVNRLVSQKNSGVISAETATELSPDSQPDEKSRLDSELKALENKKTADSAFENNIGGTE